MGHDCQGVPDTTPAPLQAHSRPLWKFAGVDNNLLLQPDDLSEEELGKIRRTLLGKDQGGPRTPIS